MIVLKTKRLILRNVRPEDAEIMYDYRNNPLCARYQRGQTKDYPGIQALVENHRADALTVEAPSMLAVALGDTDEMVGEIVVMPNEGVIALGYTFSHRHHRRGYAFEALSALTDTLHQRFPAWEFICFTDPENIPSMALLEKLGYRNLGYAPSKESQVFGKWLSPGTEEEIAAAVRQ